MDFLPSEEDPEVRKSFIHFFVLESRYIYFKPCKPGVIVEFRSACRRKSSKLGDSSRGESSTVVSDSSTDVPEPTPAPNETAATTATSSHKRPHEGPITYSRKKMVVSRRSRASTSSLSPDDSSVDDADRVKESAPNNTVDLMITSVKDTDEIPVPIAYALEPNITAEDVNKETIMGDGAPIDDHADVAKDTPCSTNNPCNRLHTSCTLFDSWLIHSVLTVSK